MELQEERFEKISQQLTNSDGRMDIWRDKETGVEYVFRNKHVKCGGSGLSTLATPDGKPMTE